ncbi:HET-domain-containing protein, partial [Aulographum hederae CBS 113979]
MIRKWMSSCNEYHSDCAEHNPRRISHFWLIDCETRMLAKSRGDEAYTALSYVWGNPAPKASESAIGKQLPSQLPQTIEDAMTVTRKLDLQYIWIDRYCILQTANPHKSEQLRQMDKVYHNACITLVAAVGTDPSHGLPGVGPVPRVPQPSVKVADYLLASSMSNPKLLIRRSPWMTRAWTYQEAICSRRLLAFTEQQVYYECG